jgi:cupin superfamily acireductone dioxygenase involved in methionine salvage
MVRSLLMPQPRRPRRTDSPAPRAPRRQGARTTLRVPDDLAEIVERYAQEHMTSTNDALIRLAYDGARIYDANREREELARVRRAAIRRLPEVPPGTELPSAEETAEAILAWRLGLVDEEEFGA